MGQHLSACFRITHDERGTREMRRLHTWSEQEPCKQLSSSRAALLTAETLRYFCRRAGASHRSCPPPVRHALVVNTSCGTGDMTEPAATRLL